MSEKSETTQGNRTSSAIPRAAQEEGRGGEVVDRPQAGASCHLAGHAEQAGIGFFVEGLQPFAQVGPRQLWRNLGQPDQGLDGFQLAEEERRRGCARAPVLQEARCLVADAPLAGRQLPPAVDLAAHLVDEVVLGESAAFGPIPALERELGLTGSFALLRIGDGNEMGAWPPVGLDGARRIALAVQLPMARRLGKRRVEDGIIDLNHELDPTRGRRKGTRFAHISAKIVRI